MKWLIRHRAPALLLIDLIMLQFAIYLIYMLRYSSGLFREPLQPQFFPIAAVLSVYWIVLFALQGIYSRTISTSRFEAVVSVFKAVVIGIIILFFISMDPGHPVTNTRIVLFSYGILLFVFVAGGHSLFRTFIRLLYIRRIGLFRSVIFGCGPRAMNLYRHVSSRPEYGYKVRYIVCIQGNHPDLDVDVPCISLEEFERIAADHQDDPDCLEYALVALETEDRERALEVIDLASRHALSTMIEPDFMQILVGYAKTRELYGVPLLEVFPSLMTPTGRILKRLLDLFVTILLLTVGLPLMMLIAIAIRIDSKGPALYRQKRVGYRGREFTLVKFRTMRMDAERETGAVWATPDDPRVTRVGRFLRSTRLDELPQILNVLIGVMSLVGPRPERRIFVEEFSKKIPFYSRRMNVKPGITGWAQIRRGYDTSLDDVREKLQYDLFYLENMSISLDIKILLNTLWVMITAKGH
ncbi:MAG: sugar transferase [bacterium]